MRGASVGIGIWERGLAFVEDDEGGVEFSPSWVGEVSY